MQAPIKTQPMQFCQSISVDKALLFCDYTNLAVLKMTMTAKISF